MPRRELLFFKFVVNRRLWIGLRSLFWLQWCYWDSSYSRFVEGLNTERIICHGKLTLSLSEFWWIILVVDMSALVCSEGQKQLLDREARALDSIGGCGNNNKCLFGERPEREDGTKGIMPPVTFSWEGGNTLERRALSTLRSSSPIFVTGGWLDVARVARTTTESPHYLQTTAIESGDKSDWRLYIYFFV